MIGRVLKLALRENLGQFPIAPLHTQRETLSRRQARKNTWRLPPQKWLFCLCTSEAEDRLCCKLFVNHVVSEETFSASNNHHPLTHKYTFDPCRTTFTMNLLMRGKAMRSDEKTQWKCVDWCSVSEPRGAVGAWCDVASSPAFSCSTQFWCARFVSVLLPFQNSSWIFCNLKSCGTASKQLSTIWWTRDPGFLVTTEKWLQK